eukprot:jgi/Chlat1/5973/Chrsp4S06186
MALRGGRAAASAAALLSAGLRRRGGVAQSALPGSFSSLLPPAWHAAAVTGASWPEGRRGMASRSNASLMQRVSYINYGIRIVPERTAMVVERLGKYHKTLLSGIHVLIPLVTTVASKYSFSSHVVLDPKLASYGVEDPIYAVTQLAQTTMRSELGKITLDKTFEERDTLNANIVIAINEAAASWGLECMRYEIRDISPPSGVRAAMEMQAEAERRKRAQILDSEGDMQSSINVAEGKKKSVILASEANMMEQVNRAKGEAEAILARAKATAEGLMDVSSALTASGGMQAASLRVAEQYITAFSSIAKQGNTMLLPSNASDPAQMVAQAMGIYATLSKSNMQQQQKQPPHSPSDNPPGSSSGGGDETKHEAGGDHQHGSKRSRSSSSSSSDMTHARDERPIVQYDAANSSRRGRSIEHEHVNAHAPLDLYPTNGFSLQRH